MKKHVKFLTLTSIILAIINTVWLVYNTFKYLDIDKWFNSPEIYGMLIFIGLLVLFFSHLIINLAVVLSLKKSNSTFISGIVLLIIGAVSFIALFFHWGCLTDILKEYPAGLEIKNELKFAWISQIIHFSFSIYALIYFIKHHKSGKEKEVSESILGEQLFISLNIIGIVCGFTGLFIVLLDSLFIVNPHSYKWAIIPYSFFVLAPYLIILTGWFIHSIRNKLSVLYDEKQKSDIYKSGMFTLLISIPLMLILFILNYNTIGGAVSILWLPFYLFIVLSVFSLTALYNFTSN